jgi:hypothetical protein
MKKKKILLTGFITVMVSCFGPTENQTFDSISGTYVKTIKQEFATGTDTIVITPLASYPNKYTIVNATSYTQTIDGKILSPKTERHKWIADYDNTTLELTVQNKEKTFHYIPSEKKLVLGKSEYKKIIDD